MSDDLLTLRMLVVSDATSQRDIWRQGAGLASIPIDFDEAATSPAAAEMLGRQSPDILLIDSELTGACDLIKVARSLSPVPLILACAETGASARLDGVDGSVPPPAGVHDARDSIDRCIKFRMPMRVMIVDDSATMRAIVRKILGASRFKLNVSDAPESGAALASIKSGAVDMVFLDYNMPGLNGIETLSEIKRSAPKVAVVMMTSTLDPSVADRAEAAGVTGFLKKPFFPKDVDAVLERHHGLTA
jgi:CheY-like chemotaxis protein